MEDAVNHPLPVGKFLTEVFQNIGDSLHAGLSGVPKFFFYRLAKIYA